MMTARLQARLLAATMLAGLAPFAAHAQDAPAPAAPPEREARSVEKIVVTAQKREQGIQDVPVAVSAYNADLLDNSGVNDFKDLQVLAPGLNVTSTSNEFVTTARIRGIGTVGDNPGLESSVGVVIDGVPRARNGTGFNDLGEIERIEILRGPQGTLFGKNTSAGIINVVTRRPEFDFGASLEAGYIFDEAEGYGVAGSVTGPIVEDKAAFRLYGVHRKRDGFLTVDNQGPSPALDTRTEDEDYDQDFWSVRGQLLLEPSSNVSLLLAADYTDRDENCCLGPSIVSGATAPIINALAPGGRPLPGAEDPFSRRVQSNRSTAQQIEDFGYQGQLDWDLGGWSLTAIASRRDYELNSAQDTDFTGADIVFRDISLNAFEFGNTTFEVRAAGASEHIEWLFGAYFSDEELTRRDAVQLGGHFAPYLSLLVSSGTSTTAAIDLANGFGAQFIPNFGQQGGFPLASFPLGGGSQGDRYDQDSQSLSLFTNNTISITDRFDITVGARWTQEDKSARFEFADSVNPACDIYEQVLGNALDLTLPQNQAIVQGYANAAFAGNPSLPTPEARFAAMAQVITFTCLPFSRDVYAASLNGTQSREEEEFSGKFAGSYRFTDDILGYASYSRGYKAGGFNLDRFDQAGASRVDFTGILAGAGSYPAQFEPEIVDAYEVGFKTEWLNNQLLANFFLFYSDFETYQLNTFNGIAFFVTSVPGAESKGAELELLYLPDAIDGLTLQGGVTHAETTYNEFAPTGTPDVDRLSGRNFSLSPEWYVTGAASIRRPIPGTQLEWLAHVDGRWVSEQNTGSDLDPEKLQESYWLVNGRLGIGSQDERWALEVWSRNLLDEDYIQVGFDGPFQPGSFNAFLGAPRTYGVTLRSRF